MAEYDRMTVVEIAITIGFGMAAWRDTPNGRVNQRVRQETWRTLLYLRMPAGKTVHVWVKHSVIHTCIQNLHVRNKEKYYSVPVCRTYTCELVKY